MTWLNRKLYPFPVRTFRHADGDMCYVDVGIGDPIVFVHGTPTWSFVWRHAIAKFAQTHRVIAIDHLGFGLSEKDPTAAYGLADHARRYSALIDALHLRNITLVVHDFGGPIALNDAINRPGIYRRLVLCNTFLWPFADEYATPALVGFLQGRIGKFLYLKQNFSPRWLVPLVFANKDNLSDDVHQQYTAPFASADERVAPWQLLAELTPHNPWLAARWAQRDHLAKIPTLILRGTRDPVFPNHFLQRWRTLFAHARIATFHDAGHFVQEEASLEYVREIEQFLEATRSA